MIMFKAPPISSIMRASCAGRPPAAWRASTVMMSCLDRALISPVASTTRLLIEAMADVNVVAAVVLSASVESGPREAAVESARGKISDVHDRGRAMRGR